MSTPFFHDGGPAFPAASHAMKGMSLRDYFAAKAPPLGLETARALMGWPADLPFGSSDADDYEDSIVARWKSLSPQQQAELEARWSYIFADAMISQSERRNQ